MRKVKSLMSLALAMILALSLLPAAVSAQESPEVHVFGDWEYTLDSNDRATLVNYTGEALTVRTPETVDGNTVTTLFETFKGNTDIVSVSVSSGILTIGESAFEGCSRLVFVSVAPTVRTIGEAAFKDCSRLMSVILPNSVQTIGTQAFMGCTSLTSVTIPDSVAYVDDEAFWCCSSLSEETKQQILEINPNARFKPDVPPIL
jgi:hypothetical protein